jgi:hypothetical protein
VEVTIPAVYSLGGIRWVYCHHSRVWLFRLSQRGVVFIRLRCVLCGHSDFHRADHLMEAYQADQGLHPINCPPWVCQLTIGV